MNTSTMDIKAFFDARTFTMTYVVYDPRSRDAVVIDPVLDYEPAASKTWTESVDQVVSFLRAEKLKPHFILETHAHADHLSGSQAIKEQFPNANIAIGSGITKVQTIFKRVFDLPNSFPTDGSQFDRLLRDGETVTAGTLSFKVIFTPGHTPACATYQFQDALFTGDALFMPDQGTGRCDFPGGSATELYRSVHGKLYAFPDDTRVFIGHDYQPGDRALMYESTIGQEKAQNIQLPVHISEQEFVTTRTARDKTLSAPKLLFQSVQVNIDGGRLPEPAGNETRYLRIPINVFKPEPEGKIEIQPI